jgi:hypothetical protein
MHDFRRLSLDKLPIGSSPKLALEVRQVLERREWALELLEDFGEMPPEFSATASIEEGEGGLAARLRIAIGVTTDQQTAWAEWP